MSRLRRIVDWDRLFFITTNLAPNAPFLQPPEMDLLLDVLNTVRRATGFLLLLAQIPWSFSVAHPFRDEAFHPVTDD